jgi:hypothetical protein
MTGHRLLLFVLGPAAATFGFVLAMGTASETGVTAATTTSTA